MSLVPVERDRRALEADPVEYMAVVLHRAKGWLAEAQDVDSVREAKAIAVGYEAVIREKELAFDAQLSATEIVRRCERRLGELAPRRGDIGRNRGDDLSRSETLIGQGKTADEHRTMAAAADEAFDAAVDEARSEGNLSRANVVRKLRPDGGGESFEERAYRTWAQLLTLLSRVPVAASEALEMAAGVRDRLPAEPNEWLRVISRIREAIDSLEEEVGAQTVMRRIK